MNLGPSLFAIIIGGIIIWAIWDTSNYQRKKSEELRALKDSYDSALKSNDKAKALEVGRKYYSHLRKGRLTVYDEQAITNDLMTMK